MARISRKLEHDIAEADKIVRPSVLRLYRKQVFDKKGNLLEPFEYRGDDVIYCGRKVIILDEGR